MRKLLLILTLLFSVTLSSFNQVEYSDINKVPNTVLGQSFNAGYQDGYIDGYCNGNNNCFEPSFIPYPPMPPINHDNYKGGYLIGFKRGLRDSPY